MHQPIKILILDKNINTVELYKQIIKAELAQSIVETASTFLEFNTAMENNKFDLILSDYFLTDFNGNLALQSIQNYNNKIPFIFISNNTEIEEIFEDLLDQGATDYYFRKESKKVKYVISRYLNEIKNNKELHERELILRMQANLLHYVNNAIIATNAQGIITYSNVYTAKLFGWDTIEITSMALFKLIPQAKQYITEITENKGAGILRTEQICMFRKPDGSEIQVNIVMSSWCNAYDILDGFLLVATDVTDKLKVDEQLVLAKKYAEEINNLKSYFLANMSHEFRIPLNSIIGFAEILDLRITDDNNKEMIGYILNGAKRLFSSLNHILELSAIEIDTINIDRKTCNIGELVNNIMIRYKPNLKQKNIAIKYNLIDTSIEAVLDPMLLEKILHQLIENGIKFTQTGIIEVKVYKEFKNGIEQAIISCTDTGIGIQKTKLEKIFEPYIYSEENASQTYEETGLGLAIIKKYVELMQGAIYVESEPNLGSTFYLAFNAIAISNTTPNKNLLPKNNYSLAEPKILLVEDNEPNRMLIKTYLEDIFAIEEACTGEEAISKLHNYKYIAILMDIHLGEGIDGIETMKRIKKNENFNKIPIIAVTAYAMQNDEKNLLCQGFDAYIAKPFSQDLLFKTLQEFIDVNL